MLHMDAISILGIIGMATIVSLSIVLVSKMEKLRQLQSTADNLKKVLDEMDEQAKLIVRTDMELNKTQEELDKKVAGLYTLQRLARSISTTLDEIQIFKIMEYGYLEDIGFEKAVAFLWDENDKKFYLCLNIGYKAEEIETIKSFINSNQNFYVNMIRAGGTISSISKSMEATLKNKMTQIFKIVSFVISPILPKEGNKGFFFVGTENPDTLINEGDEELITILVNQLGQALENARLFDKTWRSQQGLEKKVEERTKELTLALEEVKKVSKRKTDFISSVSHELRTPLTSIKGYASILLAGKLGNFSDEIRERIDKMNRHSDELVHLVNDLLDISRIESGRVAMKLEPLDLKEIADQVVDLLSLQAKEKQIEVKADIPSNANRVLADRGQIERVLINLVGNALKFTPAKGKITISAAKINGMAQIDITDTGYGIPPEAQEAIFEEFYRVDNPINQQVKGTGLGLTLVKHIIEAHKGKIWVRSRLGSGATFSFTLPQAA